MRKAAIGTSRHFARSLRPGHGVAIISLILIAAGLEWSAEW
jgi:hypothetical protein